MAITPYLNLKGRGGQQIPRRFAARNDKKLWVDRWYLFHFRRKLW
jgi:hypothetical protein